MKPLVILAGPTAVGKTALSIKRTILNSSDGSNTWISVLQKLCRKRWRESPII